MKCPFCGYTESKVNDSRPTGDDTRIRRRRECIGCGRRFTTYEAVETTPVIVVKRDNSRELFNRDKLLQALLRACVKRPVSVVTLEKAVDEIEAALQNSLEVEVSSSRIGEYAMDKLREIDQVSYVRFASVYREFQDIETFSEEINRLLASMHGDGRKTPEHQ